MSFSRYVIEIGEPVSVSALLSANSITQSDRFLPVGQLVGLWSSFSVKGARSRNFREFQH